MLPIRAFQVLKRSHCLAVENVSAVCTYVKLSLD